MNRFAQSAGPIGPINIRTTRFNRTPHPWVNFKAGLGVGPATPAPQAFRPAQAATATIAGRPHIGCCAGCAADYRSK